MKLKEPLLHLNPAANGKSSSEWERKMFSYWPVRYGAVILSCVVFIIWYYRFYQRSSISRDQPWDLILFTQSYPITCCLWNQVEKNHNYCHFARDRYAWTIHGIWPSMSDGEGPHFCKQFPFNESAIESIKTELEDHWPSVATEHALDFWKHEWRKHGTCALEDQPFFDSEYTYFKLGLDWNNRYNITRVLNEAGIIPSNNNGYSKSAFHEAIRSALGKTANLDCFYYEDLDAYFINEIRLCMDKSLNLLDCEKSYSVKNTCPDDGIIYPDNLDFARL